MRNSWDRWGFWAFCTKCLNRAQHTTSGYMIGVTGGWGPHTGDTFTCHTCDYSEVFPDLWYIKFLSGFEITYDHNYWTFEL